MSNLSILKIETKKGIVLVSNDAIQELSPLNQRKIMRNINFEVLPEYPHGNIKYRCLIETKDTPNVSLLQGNEIFTIYSLIRIRQDDVETPTIDYVKDSVEKGRGFITFRPILRTLLTDFKAKANNTDKSSWKFEFEEV